MPQAGCCSGGAAATGFSPIAPRRARARGRGGQLCRGCVLHQVRRGADVATRRFPHRRARRMSRRLSGPCRSLTVKSVPPLSSAEQIPAKAIAAGRWSRLTGHRNRLALPPDRSRRKTPQSSRQLQECQTGKNRPELPDKQLDLGYAAEDAAASLTAAPQRSAITNRLHFCLQIVRLGICAVPKANVAIKGLRTDLMNVRR